MKTLEKVMQGIKEGLYREHPEQYLTDALDHDPWDWQTRAIRQLFLGEKHRLSVVAPHRKGKTTFSALLAHYFITNYVPSKTVVTGPSGNETKGSFWQAVKRIHERSVFKEQMTLSPTRMYMDDTTKDYWFVLWASSHLPKMVEGFMGPLEGRNLLWIVEKAPLVRDEVFHAISGSLSMEDTFCYISGVAKEPHGFFYETQTKNHNWDAIHVPPTEAPIFSPDIVNRWKKQFGEGSPIYRQRILGEFTEAS